MVNEPARLECEASGVPLPILTWLKDGSPVASVSHGLQVLINDSIEFMFRVINHTLLHHETFPKEDCGCILLYIIHYPKLVSNYGCEAKCAELLLIYINVHEVCAIETSTYFCWFYLSIIVFVLCTMK